MFKTKIFPEKKLVIMVYWGGVNFQDIMKANAEMASDPRFNQSFNGIVDHRKSNLELTHEEVDEIAKAISDNDVSVGKWALLVGSPEQTAFSMLYKASIEGQHPESVCSTIKAASEYLHVDLSEYLEEGLYD